MDYLKIRQVVSVVSVMAPPWRCATYERTRHAGTSARLRRLVEARGDRLHIEAPAGVLSESDWQQLKELKPALLELLSTSAAPTHLFDYEITSCDGDYPMQALLDQVPGAMPDEMPAVRSMLACEMPDLYSKTVGEWEEVARTVWPLEWQGASYVLPSGVPVFVPDGMVSYGAATAAEYAESYARKEKCYKDDRRELGRGRRKA
jgi:hypothetical protein